MHQTQMARGLHLLGWQDDVDVRRNGERCRGEHCSRAHLERRLHEVANGLGGAGEIRPQRFERERLGWRKRPHQWLRRRVLVSGIFRCGGDQVRELFRAAAGGVPINDVALLGQIG